MRDFVLVEWRLLSFAPINNVVLEILLEIIKTVNENNGHQLTIPKLLLDEYGTYVLEV
jgi:hypothetical protein